MSYIDESLGQNETEIYRARFPWFYHTRGWAGLIVLAVCGLIAYANGFGLLAGLLVLVGLALFIANLLPIWTTEIGVTDQRLIFKRGLLWRTTQELQLRAIEEVNLEQGFLGRLTNYGRLELRGTGVDDIVLPPLADPLRLRKALQDGMALAAPSDGCSGSHIAGYGGDLIDHHASGNAVDFDSGGHKGQIVEWLVATIMTAVP